MITRALASVKKIDALEPIYVDVVNMTEAERIQQARIGGWRFIVKKGEFNVGDFAVFFEIDSILPETDWSEFLRDKKFRIKTLKFNKMLVAVGDTFTPAISQGLALPVSILPDGTLIEEDLDVTEILGVTKYEAPEEFVAGDIAGKFPSFIPKTDELRVQSYPRLIGELKGSPYYITLKLDGSSLTAWWGGEGLQVASRNFIKKNEEFDTYWQVARACGLEEKLAKFPKIAIQGELVGEGVQKNRLGEPKRKLYVFNVFDINEQRYYTYEEMTAFCRETGLETVPVIEEGESFEYSMEDLDEKVQGLIYPLSKHPAEGIVIRAKNGSFSQTIQGRLSFKYINPLFLLKIGE